MMAQTFKSPSGTNFCYRQNHHIALRESVTAYYKSLIVNDESLMKNNTYIAYSTFLQ